MLLVCLPPCIVEDNATYGHSDRELEEAWARYQAERTPILKAFGVKLAQHRPEKESQEALGRRATLHRNEIGYLERGRREPGLLTLLILADTLGITLNDLTKGLPGSDTTREARA
jgi:DNA-binding XRE family transcriptional regulator